MSDQDTPPPHNDPTPPQDSPPPVESAPASGGGIPLEAPSAAGVGLGQGKLPESEEKTMGMLVHVLGAVTAFVGPLIIWLIKKEESPFINDQGKESLNFQITAAIAYVALGIISVVLGFIPVVGACLAMILYVALVVGVIVYCILGGMAANKGTPYRYPFALRLIS